MRISRIFIDHDGIEIASYDHLSSEDIEKVRQFESERGEEITHSDVQEAIIDVLLQNPFIQCFEDEPRTVRMLSDFSAELIIFMRDYFVEKELFRAAEEAKSILKENQDGKVL